MYLSVYLSFCHIAIGWAKCSKRSFIFNKEVFFVTMETKQELKQNEKKKILVC